MKPIDVLIIGAGPAGLATAIRVKQKFNQINKDASVVVIDKAAQPGFHSLSGAVFESACLDKLLPNWQEIDGFIPEMPLIEQDEMYFLTSRSAWRLPELLVPREMRHKGDRLVSLSRLVDRLYKAARQEGVEIYSGFSVESILWDKTAVRGVKLLDCGQSQDRQPKANFLAGDKLSAKVTVFANGAMGSLTRDYIDVLGGNRNPQVYSVGIKQIFKLPQGHSFGTNRVVHTLGFPNRPDVFGGGFFYSLGKEHLAAGLIIGLDWKYSDLSPQQEFEVLKTHPLVVKFINGSKMISSGAKLIPEGGYCSLPRLWTEGALIVGDAAGFVNMEKIKGIHYAIYSGMAAADTIFSVLSNGDVSAEALSVYSTNLDVYGVLRDLRHARNFRQVFQMGLFVGAPLSQVQSLLPIDLGIPEDHKRMAKDIFLKRDCKSEIDRGMFASLSGTAHREDEPSHILVKDPALCRKCQKELFAPCMAFCPAEVYRWSEAGLRLSVSNCLHCGTCAVKCPHQNIAWTPPEGGEGPRYKLM